MKEKTDGRSLHSWGLFVQILGILAFVGGLYLAFQFKHTEDVLFHLLLAVLSLLVFLGIGKLLMAIGQIADYCEKRNKREFPDADVFPKNFFLWKK